MPQLSWFGGRCGLEWSARSSVWLTVPMLFFSGVGSLATDTATADEGAAFFETAIRPVLVNACADCHGVDLDAPKAGLRIAPPGELIVGGDSGPAVVPGDPDSSPLIQALRYDGPIQMPPSGKLPEETIAAFERWVAQGAPLPETAEDAAARADADGPNVADPSEHWAFQPPKRHQSLDGARDPWVRQPIDGFILERLRESGLEPNPEADRRVLIRRLSFDLIGLPPTPAEVERFVDDRRPGAFDRLVDRLLASPRFGERWARRWLDLARYAEDQAHIVGNNKSLFYPNAYKYRDWVIEAFNRDLPYDAFIRRQLAADLLGFEENDELAALGFVGLGPKYYRRGALEVKAEEWEDRVDLVSRGLLGMTVACARCHDHKYDPIPTEDYYGLAGIFASTQMYNRPLHDEVETDDAGQAKDPEESLHIIRDGEPEDLPVFIRGDVKRKGEIVPRCFLSALGPAGSEPRRLGGAETSGRLELAEAIVADGNPLSSRVFVNRVWGWVFGQPLVGTPSNFGALGETPSHPRLLDDLAVRFETEGGRSLKWLVRELVSSSTYRQASIIRDKHIKSDPSNELLGRMNRRRLEVEGFRDAALAVSGALEERLGGPSIDPLDEAEGSRTVYSRISRLELNPLLARFDFPDPNAHSAWRSETTTPLQKLFVLNSPFMMRRAEELADRLSAEAVSSDPSARVEAAYRRLFARPPTAEERRLAFEFLGPEADRTRWTTYAQALLLSNEFFILD